MLARDWYLGRELQENGREGWIGRDTGEFWGEGFHREEGGEGRNKGATKVVLKLLYLIKYK